MNRRDFFRRGAAAAGAAGLAAQAQPQTSAGQIRFDHVADVVVVGAGASGLPAAIMARDEGASVIAIDANHDIGGHAMLSGGRIPLGAGRVSRRSTASPIRPTRCIWITPITATGNTASETGI